MIKKYEIITVEGKKRIKALRSFSVQGRYVNVGDVGGIVYDENTLSQEGNAWIFSGNLNYPSIRVGGDSIVDTNGYEGAVTDPRPFVNITGTSALVGAHEFVTGKKAAAKVLAVSDVEQGGITVAVGSTYEESKVTDGTVLRMKAPAYRGGEKVTISISDPDYQIKALRYDVNGKLFSASPNWVTGGPDVSLTTEDCYYCAVIVRKVTGETIALSDITTANITLSSTVIESTINIKDSRLEFNYTSAMTVATKVNPGANGSNTAPVSNISESNVAINKTGNGAFVANIFADVIKCNVAFTTVNAESTLAGTFENVKNLTYNGSFLAEYSLTLRKNLIVSGCDNFALSTATLPISGVNAANVANMPFIFTRCNVPNGRFYHHATIKNTYTDIDFALAQTDLGKLTTNGYTLCSAEVEGMYRCVSAASGLIGALVEAHDSVKALNLVGAAKSYGTTIYKDAYFNGVFEFAGTNVFGHKVRSHPVAQVLNVQPRAVQGIFNTVVVGETITGVVTHANRVSVPVPFRINGPKGITINCPTGIEGAIVCTDINGVIKALTSLTSGESSVKGAGLVNTNAYLFFAKTGGTAITPEDLAGVTVTVYNGCKIINTGSTAISMKGNIRVEDNATLVNARVTGSGYFGGDSVVYYNPAVWASLDFVGTVFMKDKAVFAPTALTGACALVRMEGNAKFIGSVDVASTDLSFIMRDNAVIEGKANTRSGVVMSGNSKVAAAGQIMAASRGVLVMEDNASIEANTTVIGAITLSGNYKGNAVKTWVGKRTITDVNSPTYDNNVKTKYDF